ncbi:hypothetical protein ACWEN3_04725 [Streptomyces sp. NPDC004561]
MAALEAVQVNGRSAISVWIDGEIGLAVAMRVEDGFITDIYSVHNPAKKLTRIERETAASR